MPKYDSIVPMRRVGSVLSMAELIFPLRFVPASGTHRSRGNERMAARPVDGSTRRIMIVSVRVPTSVPSPRKAPAYGEFGSMHSRLSDPVIKKFSASMGGPTGSELVVLAALIVVDVVVVGDVMT